MKFKPLALAALLALSTSGAMASPQSEAADRAVETAARAAKLADTPRDTTAAPEYVKDVYDILDQMQVYESLFQTWFNLNDTYRNALSDYYLSHVPKQELTEKAVPGAMKVIPADLAASVAVTMRHPAHRKRVKNLIAEFNGAEDQVEQLTPEEKQVVSRFDAEPSSIRFKQLEPVIRQLLYTIAARSREELRMKLARDALAAIERTQDEIPEAAGNGRPAEIHTIGFDPWDQVIRAHGNYINNAALSFYRFHKKLEGMGYFELVKTSSIVTRRNYQEATAMLDKVADALALTLKELDAAIEEYDQGIHKTVFMSIPAFRKKHDDTTATYYTFTGDFAESYRNHLAARRQMVAFLQERDGLATVDGQKILFDGNANVAQLNDLLKRISTTADEVNAVFNRQAGYEVAETEKARKFLAKPEK
jgi:hypothetical protein